MSPSAPVSTNSAGCANDHSAHLFHTRWYPRMIFRRTERAFWPLRRLGRFSNVIVIGRLVCCSRAAVCSQGRPAGEAGAETPQMDGPMDGWRMRG